MDFILSTGFFLIYGKILRKFSKQKYNILNKDIIKLVEKDTLNFDAVLPKS
jgi:hypothetical protein